MDLITRAWVGLGCMYTLKRYRQGVRKVYRRLKILDPPQAEDLFWWAVQ